eukprot:superscaffoldBa00005345_g20221
MFNQEPAEEQGQISESPKHEEEPRKKEEYTFKDNNSDCQNSAELKSQNLDYKNQKSEIKTQNLELTNWNSEPKTQKSEILKRRCSEPYSKVSSSEDQFCSCPHMPEGCRCKSPKSCYSEEGVDCLLQVDNGSEGDDSFLQREGSQRRSRRRFRRVNPRGERELITDGQEPASYNTIYRVSSAVYSFSRLKKMIMQVGPAEPQGPLTSSATARPSRTPGREGEPGRRREEKNKEQK